MSDGWKSAPVVFFMGTWVFICRDTDAPIHCRATSKESCEQQNKNRDDRDTNFVGQALPLAWGIAVHGEEDRRERLPYNFHR